MLFLWSNLRSFMVKMKSKKKLSSSDLNLEARRVDINELYIEYMVNGLRNLSVKSYTEEKYKEKQKEKYRFIPIFSTSD